MRETNSQLRKPLKIVALAIAAVGVLLMIMKIVYDSEPGAIPLVLILMGVIAYGIFHFRMPSPKK